MTNKILGTIFYVVSVISLILALASAGYVIAPDPLPIAVDDALAVKAGIDFFIVFVASFIAGSCLKKDGCAADMVDNMSKAGNAVKFGANAQKLVQ